MHATLMIQQPCIALPQLARLWTIFEGDQQAGWTNARAGAGAYRFMNSDKLDASAPSMQHMLHFVTDHTCSCSCPSTQPVCLIRSQAYNILHDLKMLMMCGSHAFKP